MKTYEINYMTNKGQYDGEEVEADSLEDLCNEILRIAYSKKISSIQEVVELD